MRRDPAWDAAVLISCSLYAVAHLLAHKNFAVAFVRHKGVQLLADVMTRAAVTSANEVRTGVHVVPCGRQLSFKVVNGG